MHTSFFNRVVGFVVRIGKKFPVWFSLFLAFVRFFSSYSRKKILFWSTLFENNKNLLVKFFIAKRGRYNRPFLHITTMGVIGLCIVIAPLLADTYPIFSPRSSVLAASASQQEQQSIIVGENVFQTDISQKPRDQIITYHVQKGDTLSTIAQKFGVSEDTLRWENDLTSDDLAIDDELKILPVTGIAHKVQSGDTVYSIAKKYDTEAQKIVDFPFNDFANPETFSLVVGQILVVPDGIKPSEQPFIKREVYIAQGPITITASGFTWPVHGLVTQFASWYHMALDIAAPVGTPIVAAHSGKVIAVSVGTWDGGYGTSVQVGDSAGYTSHYAHMNGVNVSAGDTVTAGQTVVGWIGMTGRTTGPHVHFEIRKNGVLIDPLPYLK